MTGAFQRQCTGVGEMKRIALAVALSALGVGTSVAADMAVKARPAPLPVAVANWTGCYLGAGGGYGMFNQRREVVAPVGDFATGGVSGANTFAMALTGPAGSVVTPNETFGGQGWLATGQVGCDYQFSNNWLIGAFADADWTNLSGDHSLLGAFRGQQSMQWSWAVGGRVGWLVTPTLLTYVTGGYTQAEFGGVNYANNFATTALAVTNPPMALALAATGNPGLQLGSQRFDGFFIGGGTEYAIGWLPGLFWKNEYRYADYRSASTNIICTICTAAAPGPVGQTGLAERQHPTVQTVRTELVWRFNWSGAPVAAKY